MNLIRHWLDVGIHLVSFVAKKYNLSSSASAYRVRYSYAPLIVTFILLIAFIGATFVTFFIAAYGNEQGDPRKPFIKPEYLTEAHQFNGLSQILSENFSAAESRLVFGVPVVFGNLVVFEKGIQVQGESVFLSNISAPNIVYSVRGEQGITVEGDQELVITNNGVITLQGESGDVQLEEGSGILIDGTTITNTGVLSIQGQQGAVSFTAGDGITIDGTTISLEEAISSGTSVNTFGTIAVTGQSSLVAGSSNATFTIVPGAGMAITTNPSNNSIQISATGGSAAAGWSDDGTVVRLTDATDFVGIGTASPTSNLEVVGSTFLNGATTIGGALDVTGTVTLSGLTNGIIRATGGVLSTTTVDLASSDVTGILPVSNGGTGVNTTFTSGSVIFSNGTTLAQDNAGIYFDATSNRLGVGTSTPNYSIEASGDIKVGDGGSLMLGQAASDPATAPDGSIYYRSSDDRFRCRENGSWKFCDTSVSGSLSGTGANGQISFFTGVNTLGGSNNFFWDQATNRLGIGTSTPTVPLEINGNTKILAQGDLQLGDSDSSDFISIQSPATLGAGGYTLTLPDNDGSVNQVLTTDGSGLLSWQDVTGLGGGSITAVGDVTNGAAFTASGTAGTSLWFYDADGRGQLTIANLSAARTYTLPDITGTFALLEGTQIFTGAKTFSSLLTANGGLTLEAGDTFTFNSDAFTDLTGTGLQILGGALQTTLGTSIDLASAEVTGTLGLGNGGTGVTTTPTNGQILIGNGTGYVLSTISGTANQINIANGVGSITLSTPQSIDSNANVNFNSVTVDTQAGITLSPYGATAGNTAEARFSELAANGSNYVALKAPDNIANVPGNVVLTLPNSDGDLNQVLVTDGNGNLSFTNVNGITSGDISAIGDVTSGDAFTASGTQGTSLYFYDADGRGQLTIANLSAARTYTLPDITGTFALLEGTQTFAGAKTFSTLATFNGGVTMEAGDIFTFNSDAFTDLTGTGLQISAGSLQTTLGTTVDLTTEVTGTLPVANGGTGTASVPTNGQLLIGNSTGYTLATLTDGTGITITEGAGSISIANAGVTSLTGTSNQVSVSGSTGAITISLPQNIDSNANVSFNSVTTDTQSALTVNPYGIAAGNTGEARFGELAANGSNYVAIKAPDNVPDAPGNVTLTLPNSDGNNNEVLITDGNGNLSWTTVSGIGAGDIQSIGDVASGDAFTAAGTSGTALWFYDADGRGQLTIANLTSPRTYTLPDITGTFALLEGTQSFSGAKTFTSLATFNGGVTLEAGDTFTFNSDAFTDLTGTGLQISAGALQTTLGTSVDLTSEVTGTLPVANGGTGVSTVPTNGQLLIGNGTGYSVASITGTTNQISVANGSGTITLSTPQNIDTNATVNFNSVTLDTQGGIVLNPYGIAAGNTGEVRFGELAANGSNYVAIKAPDNVPDAPGNVVFTLPADDGDNNFVMTTDGNGNLSWQSVGGIGGGDIQAIGDVSSGDAFTAAGTAGTSLWFYDADGRGQLTIANLTSPRTYTLPDITGTFALLEGTQTFSGAKTFSSLATFTGGVSLEAGDTLTFNSDDFTDFTGTGLQITSGSLETTLGTSVSLTSEITGTLPVANGGTGVSSAPTNGQLLIGNGTGYTLATITGTSNQISVANASGSITLSTPQNIDTNASVNFNTVTVDAQSGIVLNPFGGSAGEASELRFVEVTGSGSNYAGFKAPDSLDSNDIYTLPSDYPGTSGYLLSSTTGGVLSWVDASGLASGDISAIGDVTSGDAFTAAGTQGTSLWFYDADGRGQLTLANLTAARTYTLPDLTGTFALLEGTQSFSGAKTFTSLATFNGGVTMETGDTFTFNGDAFTDLTGTGLQIAAGSLQTTLGTTIDLTSEITGTLPIANGGTGVTTTPSNGQLLIGNGSGYTVATLTGTANQISVANGSGTITLSTPQNIDSNANVNFNSVTTDTQAALTLNPYGVSAGNTGEARFGELAANGSNFVALRAPDNVPDAPGNITLTLPNSDGNNNEVLVTDGAGNLSWQSVSGVGAGDISAIGDVTSGDAFTAAGTQGTALWFYDADGRGQLTVADLTAARTFTLPDITGTFAMLEGTQSFSGAKTFTSLATFNGGITLETGDTFTFNTDSFTDLTGTGLQINAGSLETTLGTTVSLTSEVTGTLPVANGGTGLSSNPSNGQLLIGNGTGYTLATLTGTTNQIAIANASGSITLSTPQNIDSNANVNFNSVTTDTQAALTLNPYGSSAGNTGEARFGELAANGSNFVSLRAPDNVPDAPGNVTLTLPDNDGNNNEVLVTDGAGNLSWQSVSGIGAGDISSIGDVTSGDAFTAAGTQGTALWFYDADGRGQLTIANLTAARTFTLPDISGTFAMLEGTQSFSGAKTFTSLTTFNGGVTLETGDTLTFNGDAFTDLTGTGLQITGGTLETTLGTSVDLASAEVTNTLGVSNGGTGLSSTASNGQLLIGNGSGYTLATITGTTNQISVANGSGSITLSTPQNINTDAAVNFNSLTVDTQGAITLLPFNTAAGNTSEIRFNELTANGSSYTGFKAPDDLGATNSIYTLPTAYPAANDYVLASDTNGNLTWEEVGSLVSGDITSIGDVTSGDAFTAAGTQGTSLWFYDADGRGQLTIANLTAARTFTLPDITGTFAMLEGTQTFSGDKTFSSNTTFSSTITTADNQWIGLGGSAGRIEFDDQTTDEVNILSARLGIGTSAPNYALDVAGDVKVGDGSVFMLGQQTTDPNPASIPDGAMFYDSDDDRFRCLEGGTWKFCDTSTSGSLSGSASTGQVAFYNGSSTLTGTNNFFWDSAQSRLGLGTSTPGSQLEVTGLATFNGGITLQTGDTLTFNGDAFTDLTGTGLQISSGSLQTTLGTTVDLTSEITGTLPVANGGTGVTTTPSNGQLLIGNGTGYTVATLTGTTNQVSVANGAGTITLSTPQDINTDATVNFNSLTVDTQGGITLLPFNTSTGNTSEIRFSELAANGSHYTGFKAPDDLGASSSIYTLPTAYPGGSNYVLTSDTSGVLSWTTVSGAGGGQVNTVGSMSASSVFADSGADDDWLGLGATAGRIEFDLDGGNTDEVNILDADLGIGTSTPTERLEVGGGNIFVRDQGDLRLGDSDSTNYVAIQAPATLGGDVTLTLPDNDGDADQVLVTDGSGNLSWQDVSGVSGAGDITAIGDVTSGAAFTSSGTAGTSLWFYDADGRGQLTIDNLTAARTYTLPDITGTFAMLEGTQTFSGAKTFTSLATFNGGVTLETGDTLTFNGDAFTDLTGTGLQINAGSLETTLGTTVSLTSEVTGTLPIANGGTGVTTTPSNGQLLIGNGSGYTVATLTGTTNQVSVANGAGTITLSTPQDIDTNAAVNFNSVTLDTQGAITLNPYNTAAGNTSEIRFNELAANGSSYVGFKAPDDAGSSNSVYTLPSAYPAGNNYILASSTTGTMSWIEANTLVSGDISAIGDVTSGDAFTAAGTAGTSLWFYDADGRGQLTIDNLSAARTYTLPDITGTFAMLEGTQTFSGAKTFTSLATFNGGVTLETGDTLTFNGDTFTDLTGTGLQITTGVLETTLGTTVSLTTEITGTLPIANGGTGVTATPSNGQLLIGNGTGYTLATITGTSNQISVANGAGSITLSTPQDINTDANVNFNSLTTDTQGGVVLLPYGSSAGNTGETRFRELSANGSNYVALKAPDNVPDAPGNITLTLPNNDGNNNEVLVTDGAGNLSWQTVSGVGAGDIQSIGDVTSGDAFTAAGTAGTSLWFYDADGRGQLTIDNLTAARTYTLPDITGTFAMLEGTQTFSGAKTFSSLATFNGGVTLETGDTLTFNGDAFTDLTGTGLQITSGVLETTLGTSVSLTSEVTGTLPIANGGTGVTATPTNGQLLIGNGTGYTLANISGTSNQISVANGAGSITLSTPQDINADANVNFNSATFDTQSAITLLPYNTGAGNTSEIRFRELAANGSNYIAFRAPDNLADGAGNLTFTLPSDDGTDNYVLTTDGNGVLAWESVSGVGAGDISAIGDVTSGDAFTAAGTQGTSLWFYDADGRGQLTIANLTAARTFTLPDITGTFALLEGTQSFSGAKTFTSLTTFNGGVTLETGDTLTFNGDAFTDLTGTGLQITSGVLETTLGTSVSLTSEITGTLPIANGGTGVTTTPSNGQLLIGNGSGYTVATLTGTSNQIAVANGSGTITLSTPQDINTDAAVNFNSLTVDTQGGVTLLPYGSSAGNTGETRFRELSANGSNYVALKAPDNVPDAPGNVTLTLPNNDGNNNEVLVTDGAGNLSWQTVSGVGAGDIQSIGDVTSGDAFTAAGTAGTSLWFYDADGRGQLTIDNLSAARTYTLPDLSGTFAMLEGTQSFSGAKTFTSLATFNGGVTLETGDTLTFNGDAFTDLTGTGLQITSGVLETTLGTSVSLTSEITGTLPIANGGTGVTTTPSNGQLLIGNGTGYTVATLTGTANQISIANGSGTITLSTPQDINTDAAVNFNSLTTDTQGGVVLLPYGSSAGNTGEVRFRELSGNGSNFVALRSPDNVPDAPGNITLTLPNNDGDNNQVLVTDGNGNLSFASVSGVEAGDISAIGDVTSGDAFTAAGTQGTSLWFYDADGRGQLTIANLTAARTFTLPDITGTFAMLEGTQTFSGAKTFSSLATFNGGVTLETGDTLTFNGDAFTDLTGTGLQINAGTLESTLGTSVSLTTEVTGTLPIANGGTGVTTTPSNGQLLIGNGSGYTVATLTGTANQISIANGAGSITLSTPQDINTDAAVNFNSATFDTQAALTLLPYNTAAGNTSEIRFRELAANGSNYVAFRAPDNLADGAGNLTFTLPSDDGTDNYVLTTDGNGVLAWESVSGVGAGDISAIGDVTSGDAFTAAGTQGTSLWFYDADGRGQLTIDNLTAARTYTLPDLSGTFAMLEGTQSFSGAKTFTSLATFNGGVTLETGDTLTFNGDAFTDLTGTGLQITSGVLETTLGTSVSLTSEITGTLPIANGGTGVTTTPSNGQLLIGNGSSYTVATLTGTANQISIANGSGSITLSTPQDINTDAAVNFNSLTVDTQGGVTLLPYGSSAGNTGETRFRELNANGSNYVALRAPDNVPDAPGNVTLTLPSNDGDSNQVLITDGNGNLSFASVSGVEAGDISAIGDVTSGDAFTAAGTAGTSLWFYDADGRGQLTIDNLTAARTFTLPDITGTFAMLEGTQTFGGAKTFTSLATFNGGVTLETGDTLTFNGDAFTDLTGTGLQITSGVLETTLGTSVDLTSEITGVLPVANGGTGAASFTTGSIIFYDGTTFAENNTGLYWDDALASLGLGTTAPERAFGVVGGINVDAGDENVGDLNQALVFGDGNVTGEGISSKRTAGGNQYGMDFYTANVPRLQITNTGAIGIGTNDIQTYSGITYRGGDDPVFTIEDYGDGVGYLATDAQDFIVGSEGNINLKTGVTFLNDGPIVSGTSRLYIEGATGEVGIGVTNPNALLDIGGNVYVRDQNDIRLGDGDSSAFVALQAPATLGGDVTLTLPDNDGDTNQVLITDGNGNLSWTSVSGVEAGDISAIGDVTSGDAFTAAGTAGTSLWFYDADGRGQLTIDNLSAAQTYTLPDITGTFAMLEGTQSFSGTKTFTSLATFNGGVTLETGDTLTFNGDAFTDLTGTGLQITSGVLETTLGTSVSLTSEITGTLPIANGGTGVTTTPSNGQLLIGNGSGYTVATLTGTSNQISVANGAGTITLSTPQDINTDANVNFNSLTVDTQGGITLLPFNTAAGNTGEIRFNELTANGSAYTGFKAPDQLGTTNSIYTLPTAYPGANNYALVSQTDGTLSWASIGGLESGDITAVGTMTSGLAFGDATADDDWLGLGASAGRIEFDDQTTDEVNILGARLGVGTTAPAATADFFNTTEQLRLSYDVSNFSSFSVSSAGDLTINPNGADTGINGTLTLTGSLGNISTSSTGNNLNFSRAGANYIDATNASGTLNLGARGVQGVLSIAGGAASSLTIASGATANTLYLGAGQIGVGNANPSVAVDVTGDLRVRAQGDIRLADSDSSDAVALQASATTTGYTLTFPAAVAGGSNYALVGDNTGALSWLNTSTFGDITSVGSFGSGAAFNDSSAHNQWLGLGASAGRIHFTDAADDVISVLGARLGIGTTGAAALADILGTTEQLRLSYDVSNYSSFTTSSGGDLTIAPSGSDTNITGNLAISGNTTLGDASGDTISFTGRVNTDILPSADDTYDLGSSSNRWQDLYLGPTSLHLYSTAGETTTLRDWNVGINETDGATDGNFRIREGSNEYLTIGTTGNLGLGTTNPAYKLQVDGTIPSGANQALVRVEGTSTDASNDQAGFSLATTFSPGSASTQTYRGLRFFAQSASGNISGGTLAGLDGGAFFSGTGTLGTAYGAQFYNTNTSTGTISNSTSLYVQNAFNIGGGTITDNYGIFVAPMTSGTNDYGARIDAAQTQTLWISGNADNTTAAAGIAFGASRDTNLYRGAANTLQTDDSLTLNGTAGAANLTINTQGDIRLADTDSSHYSGFQANGTTTTSYVLTLPAALPGTPGTYNLTTDENGTMSFTSGGGTGDITAVGSMLSGDAFADANADDDWLGLGASAGRIEFDDQTTDEINFLSANVGIGTSTPSTLLHLIGTTEQLRVGYDASNYLSTTVGSTGAVTFNATGAGAAFTFSDNLTVSNGNLYLGAAGSANALITLYSAGASESAPTITSNSNGDLTINASTGVVNIGSGSGDIILDPGANNLLANLTSTGNFLIQDNGATFITIDSTSLSTTFDFPGTTTNAIEVDTNTLTTGRALDIASTSTSLSSGRLLSANYTSSTGSTAFSGRIGDFGLTKTLTSGTAQDNTGYILNVTRDFTLNNSGNSATVSGSAFNLSDTFTQTAGTLTVTANTAAITRTCGSSLTCSGSIVAVLGSGAGTDTTGLSIAKSSGTMTNGLVIGSGSQTITNGLVLNSTGITTDITLQNGETIDNNTDGQIKLGNTSQLVLGNQSSDPVSSNLGAMYYNTTSNTFRCYTNAGWGACGGSAATVGSMSGTTLFADATADDDWLGLGASAGRIEFDDQATDEVNILSANVGIGTSTPTNRLEVAGGNIQVNDQGDMRLADTDSSAYVGLEAAGTVTGSYTITLPGAAPANDGNTYALTVANSGAASFSAMGDITAVGSMTSAAAFADSTADDDWLGLGASAGRIEFDDQTIDEVNFLDSRIGIGTTAPSTGQQLEMAYASDITSSQAMAYMNYTYSGTAAGDLLRLNIGSSTNIGNFLNIMDNGTSLFSVSESAFTTSLPTSFTAAGDVSISYDMLFTNQTSSYIKSNAPLYIEAGESFENNDLTLKTYGTGQAIFDTPSGIEIYANVASGYAGYFFNDGNATNRNGLLVQAGLDTSPGVGTDGTLIQFYDGDGTDVGEITYDGTTTTYGTTSDARVKNNIVQSSRGLADLMQIQVRDYRFTNDPNGGVVTGFIAQELYQIYPQAVQAYFDEPEKLWGVDYGKITPLLVRGIQEQQAMINAISVEQNTLASEIDVENTEFNVYQAQSDERMAQMQQDIATMSATLSSLSTGSVQNVASIEAGLASLTDRTTILESKTANLEAEVASLSAKLSDAVLGTATASGSGSLATSSAVLDQLAVTGDTNLNNVSVTGTLTAGLLTIEGLDNLGEVSINTLGGPLKLQALGLAGVELVGGNVTIDTNGNMTVLGSIETEKVKINTTDMLNASLGTGTIVAGDTQVVINTTAVTPGSAIFVTAQSRTTAPLFVTNQIDTESFTVKLATPQALDVTFKWWIVDETTAP